MHTVRWVKHRPQLKNLIFQPATEETNQNNLNKIQLIIIFNGDNMELISISDVLSK